MTTPQEETELQIFVDKLMGETWKNLAWAYYDSARIEGASHKDAMIVVYEAIIKTSEMLVGKESN
jgi:hypothetical protein